MANLTSLGHCTTWDAIAEETTRMVLINNNPRSATVADCRAILQEMLDDDGMKV